MTRRKHVTLIGGGVIGLSTGWELIQRGADVTIIQGEDAKRSTSWSAAGILPPANLDSAIDPLDQLRGLSHRLYPEWITRLESTTGIDCGFRRCGGWYLADSPGERASMIGMTSYWKELGVDCQPVSLVELARREPALEPWSHLQPSASAWWVPEEWQIRPPHLLRALRRACQAAGVRFVENTIVSDIDSTRGAVKIRAHGQWQACEQVVLCAGAWSGQIGHAIGLEHSVIPVRGQMLLLRPSHVDLSAIVNVGQRYLVPRDDGHVLVGSCEEETGFEWGTTTPMIESLKAFAVDLIPALSSAEPVATWSGIRPMTFDGFPMIGRVPEQPHVFVAAGHFRSGWHLAPATARCMADLILGQSPEISLNAFGVGKKQLRNSIPPRTDSA